MGRWLLRGLFPLVALGMVVVVGATVLLLYFMPFPLGALAGLPGARRPPAHAASPRPASPRPTPSPMASTPTPAAPTATPTPASNVPPARLVVPAAQINARVETVGLTQGAIGVPSQPADAAWYDGSVVPGQPGNAILDGHLDWWTGPAVFLHLGQLRAGDQITLVRADGSQITFTVTGQQIYGANDQIPPAMLARSGPATVSLITCAGSWDANAAEYQQRLVVNASLT